MIATLLGIGCVALVAIIGWINERREVREWAGICRALGNEYDKLFIELCELQNEKRAQQPTKQSVRWLN